MEISGIIPGIPIRSCRYGNGLRALIVQRAVRVFKRGDEQPAPVAILTIGIVTGEGLFIGVTAGTGMRGGPPKETFR